MNLDQSRFEVVEYTDSYYQTLNIPNLLILGFLEGLVHCILRVRVHLRFSLAIECALVRVLPLCSTPPFSSLISNILLVVNYCGKYLDLNQNFVGACSLALQIFPNLPITNNCSLYFFYLFKVSCLSPNHYYLKRNHFDRGKTKFEKNIFQV